MTMVAAYARHDGRVGALVTLDLPADSPVLALPWIITFGPLSDDEEWEPVVCGPYERPHALALAEEVVADEELMAVVEPLMPHVSVGRIREEIAAAKDAAQDESVADEDTDLEIEFDEEYEDEEDAYDEEAVVGPDVSAGPPSPEEIRAGFARIAQRLSASPL
jgi:hypothetical protein